MEAEFSAVSIVPRRFWGSTCRDGSRRCGYTYPTRFYALLAGGSAARDACTCRDSEIRRKWPRLKRLWHWVETAAPALAAPGMTARNSRDCHSGPTQPAVTRHRDGSILRTSRLKTAAAGHWQQRAPQRMQAGRNPSLIEAGQPLHPSRTPLLTSCHGSGLYRSVTSAPVVPRETPAVHPAQSEKIRLPARYAEDEAPHPH